MVNCGKSKETRLTMFENLDLAMLIGQALGVVAVILGFITYQMRSQKALLVVNMSRSQRV